jgi:hypothetical protein
MSRHMEDMSTLGVNMGSMESSQVSREGEGGETVANASVATGDIDEEDIEANQKRYLQVI